MLKLKLFGQSATISRGDLMNIPDLEILRGNPEGESGYIAFSAGAKKFSWNSDQQFTMVKSHCPYLTLFDKSDNKLLRLKSTTFSTIKLDPNYGEMTQIIRDNQVIKLMKSLDELNEPKVEFGDVDDLPVIPVFGRTVNMTKARIEAAYHGGPGNLPWDIVAVEPGTPGNSIKVTIHQVGENEESHAEIDGNELDLYMTISDGVSLSYGGSVEGIGWGDALQMISFEGNVYSESYVYEFFNNPGQVVLAQTSLAGGEGAEIDPSVTSIFYRQDYPEIWLCLGTDRCSTFRIEGHIPASKSSPVKTGTAFANVRLNDLNALTITGSGPSFFEFSIEGALQNL